MAAIVPGLKRQPLKKLAPDPEALFGLPRRWREEAGKSGPRITRVAVAYEAGRDGFLAGALVAGARHRGPCHPPEVIHPTGIPVKRDHRRAKTDRLDTKVLKRAFLGWLRGEPEHCTMAAIPTLAPDAGPRRWPRRTTGARAASARPWSASARASLTG